MRSEKSAWCPEIACLAPPNGNALNLAALVLLISCTWSASNLIAIDSATLWPTFLTPFLLDEGFAKPATMATLAMLFTAAPTTHVAGKLALDQYKLWNPLRGGARFACAQAAGWSLYGAGVVIVGLDVYNRFVASSGGMATHQPLLCLICTPGFRIGIAVLTLVGNACLISSLYMFDSSDNGTLEARSRKTVGVCALACVVAAVSLTSLLACHPALKPWCSPAWNAAASCFVGVSSYAALFSISSCGVPVRDGATAARSLSLASLCVNALQYGLTLLILPFVAMSFWLITLSEMTLYHGSLLLWPSSGPPSKPRPGLQGELPIEYFDPDTLGPADWTRLRCEYVHRGIPFVLATRTAEPSRPWLRLPKPSAAPSLLAASEWASVGTWSVSPVSMS